MTGSSIPPEAADLLKTCSVSRETQQQLTVFVEHLQRWNKRINLVSKATLDDVWRRHIVDSLQVFEVAPRSPKHWLDLGTGGGFPGLICAIVAKERASTTQFTFLESDRRKSAFLSSVVQALSLNATVKPIRIENAPPQQADVITARALAPLGKLFELAHPHATPSSTLIFSKGRRVNEEILAAREHWIFTVECHQSITDADGQLLRCGPPVSHEQMG